MVVGMLIKIYQFSIGLIVTVNGSSYTMLLTRSLLVRGCNV